MIKKPIKAEVNDPLFTEVEDTQIVHTPMGTTVEPAKFSPGDVVKTVAKIDENNVEIPEGIILTVMSANGDDMYSLIGPNNLSFKLNGAYLEKNVGGNVWGNL